VTLRIEGFVDYDTIIPEEVQQALKVLGLVVAGSYASGYTSLLKMLFELEQLVDFHKYLNLTLPVIFNQLVEDLASFKFMDLSILFPDQAVSQIREFPPDDLDQMGPAKLIYYEQGVNFVKNIITSLISCGLMLSTNYCIYRVARHLPFRATHKLSRKINKRKIITVHDTLEQLVLPVFFFGSTQLLYILARPSLSWIYGCAALLAGGTLVAPFLVVLYIYSQRGR
jgi:hypothetical protein